MTEHTLRRHSQIPTELLRQIILEHFAGTPRRDADKARQSYKLPWSAIEALTLTSKVIRQLTLEAWFKVYYVHSPDDLLTAWPEFSSWTKELHCVELGTDLHIIPVRWNLCAFHRLRKLRVDFDPIQSNAMLIMRFDYPRNIVSRIQELEMHDISWPSPVGIRLIAEAFSELRVLKLSQDLIWCNLCNICRFSTFRDHPPKEIVYDKVVGLPSHYAFYLRQLKKLQHVILTIGYGLGGGTSLSENNDDVWTGECDACMEMMFTVEDFKSDWVEKKKTMVRPPALKSVKWRFRHKDLTDVFVDPSEDLDVGGNPPAAENQSDDGQAAVSNQGD